MVFQQGYGYQMICSAKPYSLTAMYHSICSHGYDRQRSMQCMCWPVQCPSFPGVYCRNNSHGGTETVMKLCQNRPINYAERKMPLGCSKTSGNMMLPFCQQLARQVVQSLLRWNRICYSRKHCDSQASLLVCTATQPNTALHSKLCS